MRSLKRNACMRAFSLLSVALISVSLILTPNVVYAQTVLNLPAPGTMVIPTESYVPVLIKGMTIHPEDPLRFDFIVDNGNSACDGTALEEESIKLIKYFLASLTVPEKEIWVNLSPNEKDRIIPDTLGKTQLGRELLAQDYLLKQLTATLMYPEEDLGSKFWSRVYEEAREKYGTLDIPIDTFNKVWIIPESASVYEYEDTVYVTEAKMKVMTDVDYQAFSISKSDKDSTPVTDDRSLTTQIIKEIIIPAIEKEVNEGVTFAPLRQIYHSLILAKWYKETLKNSLLNLAYADQNKTTGIETEDLDIKYKIYAQYMDAYKKGVYDYMREEYDRVSQEIIPRKYFSGGFQTNPDMMIDHEDTAMATEIASVGKSSQILVDFSPERTDAAIPVKVQPDQKRIAMVTKNKIFTSTLLFAGVLSLFLAYPDTSNAALQPQNTPEIYMLQEDTLTDEPEVVMWDARQSLVDSVIKNDIEKAEKILTDETAYFNINARDNRSGGSLLMFCIGKGFTELAELLIKHGADVNITTFDNLSGLMLAVSKENEYLVRLLLENPYDNPLNDNTADPNIVSKYGTTAMFLARRIGNAVIIKLLEKHGALEAEEIEDKHGSYDDSAKMAAVEIFQDINVFPASQAPGGIDMNTIEIKRQTGRSQGIQFSPALFMPEEIENIEGFVPVIIHIVPLPSIYPLLGLSCPQDSMMRTGYELTALDSRRTMTD